MTGRTRLASVMYLQSWVTTGAERWIAGLRRGEKLTISADVAGEPQHRLLFLRYAPIRNGNIWHGESGVRPSLYLAVRDLPLQPRVSVDGLLLEVPDEAVEEVGRDPACEECDVEKDTLRA